MYFFIFNYLVEYDFNKFMNNFEEAIEEIVTKLNYVRGNGKTL